VIRIPSDILKGFHTAVRKIHRVGRRLEVLIGATGRVFQDSIVTMVPTASETKDLRCGRGTRIGGAHQSQRILAYCAGDSNVSDRARCIAGVWIIGATGVDLTIEHPRVPRGILVAHLGVKCGCHREEEGKQE